MVDRELTRLAIRNRLLGLSVCTTGAITMSVAAGKFVRSSGSFITDGFAVGQEVTPSGFSEAANNERAVILSRTALQMTVDRPLTTEGAGSGKTLAVGLPGVRLFENLEAVDEDGATLADGPPPSRPYFREAFRSLPTRLRGLAATGGRLEENGVYFAHFYFIENTGSEASDRVTQAAAALFTPGTRVTAGSQEVWIVGDPGVDISPLISLDSGWAHRVVEIPWRAYPRNTIAA